MPTSTRLWPLEANGKRSTAQPGSSDRQTGGHAREKLASRTLRRLLFQRLPPKPHLLNLRPSYPSPQRQKNRMSPQPGMPLRRTSVRLGSSHRPGVSRLLPFLTYFALYSRVTPLLRLPGKRCDRSALSSKETPCLVVIGM